MTDSGLMWRLAPRRARWHETWTGPRRGRWRPRLSAQRRFITRGESMSQRKPPSQNDQPFAPSGDRRVVPAGAPFPAAPNTWYQLKVKYANKQGTPLESWAYPLGKNAATSFWDYMAFSSPDGLPPAKFKIHQRADGWAEWEIDD